MYRGISELVTIILGIKFHVSDHRLVIIMRWIASKSGITPGFLAAPLQPGWQQTNQPHSAPDFSRLYT